MRTFIAMIALVITTSVGVAADAMPGTAVALMKSDTVTVTLKDEIAFEQAKLVPYGDASKASKGNHLPLVALVGCYDDDIQLFLQLKGKVILCYLPSKTAPFPTLESGVVVGLWNADGSTCVRHDVAAYTFSDPNFRDSLLFKPVLSPSQPVPSAIMTLEQFNAAYGSQIITGYTCTNGKCVPNYAPTSGGRFGQRK